MGKVVKYCNSCEEGFAEKFGFCPNCGAQLQAFEMNPLAAAGNKISETPLPESLATNGNGQAKDFSVVAAEPVPAENNFVTEPIVYKTDEPITDPVKPEIFQTEPEVKTTESTTPEYIPEKPIIAEQPKTYAATAAAASTAAANGNGFNKTADAANNRSAYSSNSTGDDGFYVTVIEEKNVKQRNALLLGTLFLMTTLAIGGTIYSLFNKSLLIGSIGDDGNLSALLPEVEPVPIETEPPPKKDKDDGGGGGGGGREEETPASKGRVVSQAEKPITPPSVNIPQMTNPDLKLIQQTQGPPKNRPITEERAGIPGALSAALSNGMGSGGGIGSGRGAGIGSGVGNGEGSGIGTGSGSGRGNGYGGGTGDGNGTSPPPPPPPAPPKKPAVTTALRITSKPRANYTDTARQNQVQGTVTLRVTFLASGQIGSISPVNGLPYGLTEQAIAAARSIRFEPQMVNGSPATVTKQVQYSFTIY